MCSILYHFQVCEYGMNTYSAVPLDFYKKLLVVWVRCKQLLQHPIPAKTLVIGEVSNDRVLVVF